MKVKTLYYYPVKSCGVSEIVTGEVHARGFKNDRIFMLVNPDGGFLSQRSHPKMALITTALDQYELVLSSKGHKPIHIQAQDSGLTKNVKVWGDICQGVDQGDEVAQWLSNFLETKCRLVMMEKKFERPLDAEYTLSNKDQTGFADGFPFLLISQESLDDLNSRLDIALPMNRFRPNIVIDGCIPYEEDSWQQIQIGELVFDVVKPCTRCAITTTDQVTLEKSQEPLKTLMKYKLNKKLRGVTFGQNLIHRSQGVISIGDKVRVIKS